MLAASGRSKNCNVFFQIGLVGLITKKFMRSQQASKNQQQLSKK